MTATFEYAIRYRDHGCDEDTILAVDNTDQQARAIRAMLLHHGIAAEPVTVTYTVDKTVRDTTAREIVTEVAELVLQGEITLDQGMERIRLLAPGLLSEDDAEERDHRPECTREYWLEVAVTATARIQGIRDGLLDCAGYDADAEDTHHAHAVDVLAGISEHTGDGRPCGLCADIVSTETRKAA